MSYLRSYEVVNGDRLVPLSAYECDHCGKELCDSAPRVELEELDYCPDCAFKKGDISSDHYIEIACFYLQLDKNKAAINPRTGEIEVSVGGSKFSWEKSNRELRRSKQYRYWRKSVLKRDNYTCQDCEAQGVILEAHHLKPFKRHVSLRYIVSNGLTLCKPCHVERHRKRDGNG